MKEIQQPGLKETDPKIFKAIASEENREKEKIILIASENYSSQAVMEALGSVFTNKYAEGYPRRRYYGGCEFVDDAEEMAIERAKKLFSAEHVNVQPHSGSQANMTVYFSVLKPGDTILGMNLAHGGHLTHGSPVSFSGILYKSVFYGVGPETGLIDYDQAEASAREHRPKLIIVGASAYSRQIDFKQFRRIADEVGAYLMADIAHPAGLVAAGLHPNPFPHADFVTTTTHKTLRGPRGGMVMCKEAHAKVIDKMLFPGIQGGPLMHVIAAKAVAFQEALSPSFRVYQERIIENAKAMAEGLIERGYPITSGGTDTHLMLVDLRSKGITGVEAEIALDRAGITVNKNAIPFDPKPPRVTSGIRLGTPIISTRGMGVQEVKEIVHWIDTVLKVPQDKGVHQQICSKVKDLCSRFPLFAQ